MSRKSDRRLAEAASAPPNGAATARRGAALAGRLTGFIRPEVKRVGVILGAGLILAFLTTNLDLEHRGAAPMLCLVGSVLVAFCDWNRNDRRVFAKLAAVSAMAMMVALAAQATPFTKAMTDEATVKGNEASMVGPAKLIGLLDQAGTAAWEQGIPWLVSKLGEINWPVIG